MNPRYLQALAVIGLVLLPVSLAVADEKEFELEYENGAFEPDTLKLPAGEKIKLEIENEGKEPLVFFVYALDAELSVPPDSEREIYLGPIDTGDYEFENRLDEKARGALKVE
jgi:predicted DNA-binding antitoxin AbrB/MazE fold protein